MLDNENMNCDLETLVKNDSRNVARSFFETYVSGDDIGDYFYDYFGLPYGFAVGRDPYERFVFNLLKEYYKNDFYIRYSFFNRVLSKKKAISFFEMPVGLSRIDMASINGVSVGYEIKTEFDTFQRLEKQLEDYSKVFEYVYLICPESRLPDILQTVPDYCGIYSYNEKRSNSAFKVFHQAELSPNLQSISMLDSMLKEELESCFGKQNKVEILANHSFEEIGNAFKESLKKRFAGRMLEIQSKANLMMG